MRQWTESNRKLGQFAADRKGGVMLIFALAIVPLIMVLGLAADGLRALQASTLTINALDAAALAAAKGMKEENLSDSEVLRVAQLNFDANVSDSPGISYTPVQVTLNRELGKVDVTATATIETTFGRIFRVEELDVIRSSQTIYRLDEIELALMLDVTGSMGRNGKLRDMQLAAKDMVDILIPDRATGARARIALAPYAAAVNAGSYASNVTDGASVDGCVIEREGRDAYTDAAPADDRFFGAYPGGDVPSNNHYSCPNASVEPLTDDKSRLRTVIDRFSARGWTAGHLGAAWAWYLVSPDWGTVWPSGSRPGSYGSNDLIKAVVLMTDGEFNTSYLNGGRNRTSDRQARELCDAMKAREVAVYTVGFDLRDSSAIDVLRDCATDEDHFYRAENGDDLRMAFRDIAVRLKNLRISK